MPPNESEPVTDPRTCTRCTAAGWWCRKPVREAKQRARHIIREILGVPWKTSPKRRSFYRGFRQGAAVVIERKGPWSKKQRAHIGLGEA